MAGLQDFFVGGLGALVDSQRGYSTNVNDPTYRTQDGVAGQSQSTSYTDVLSSPLVIGGAVLLAVLVVVMALKK